MADIVIHFTIEGGGDAVPTPSPTGQEEQNKQNKSAKWEAFQVDQMRKTAKSLAMSVASNTIGTIGARTGNYVQQQQIETAINFGSKAVSIGSAFAANVWLGVAAVAGEAINTGFQLANYQRELEWANRDRYELQRRAGYNSNYNRYVK